MQSYIFTDGLIVGVIVVEYFFMYVVGGPLDLIVHRHVHLAQGVRALQDTETVVVVLA